MEQAVKHPQWYLRAASILLVASCVSCINGPAPKLVPVPPQEPTELAWTNELPQRIAQADGVATATIAKLEEDWTYDDPCGLVAAIMRRCDGTVTYRLHLQPIDTYVWAFTPANGTFGLFEGEQAVFIWRKVVAYRYKQCREQAGMTTAMCPVDVIPALTSDLDVLPVADSVRVDSLRRIPR